MNQSSTEPTNNVKSKRWLEPKDYLTISLSVLAFGVSAGSAYFNVVRTVESVSLISDHEPAAHFGKDGKLILRSDEEGELGLVNSGNRSVIISSVAVLYAQWKEGTAPKCDFNLGINMLTDFEPTVLKSNDVVVRKFRISKPMPIFGDSPVPKRIENGNFLLPFSNQNKGKEETLIEMCLTIHLSTPSTVIRAVTLPVFRHRVVRDGWYYSPEVEGPLRKSPTLLFYRAGTIFDE